MSVTKAAPGSLLDYVFNFDDPACGAYLQDGETITEFDLVAGNGIEIQTGAKQPVKIDGDRKIQAWLRMPEGEVVPCSVIAKITTSAGGREDSRRYDFLTWPLGAC